jgi:FixJ family two-component response regulator
VTCGAVMVCGRPPEHRGHHGGFRPIPERVSLTPRQREVVARLAHGHPVKRIYADMGITRHTYQDHRKAALTAADVGTMAELWTALGWLRPEPLR